MLPNSNNTLKEMLPNSNTLKEMLPNRLGKK